MMWQARVSFTSLMSEASVVDLPEPVGPVTSTRPRGLVTHSRSAGGRPSSSSDFRPVGTTRKAAPSAARW